MTTQALEWVGEHQQIIKVSALGLLFWFSGVALVSGEMTPGQAATLAAAVGTLAAVMTLEAAATAGHAMAEAVPAIKAAMASAAAAGGVVGAINLFSLAVVSTIGVVAIVALAVVVVIAVPIILQQVRDGIVASHPPGPLGEFAPPLTTPDQQHIIEGQIQALVDITPTGDINHDPQGRFGLRGFTVVGPVFSGGTVDLTDPNNPSNIGGGQMGPTLNQSLNLSPVNPGFFGDPSAPGFFGDPSAPGGLPGIGQPSGPAPAPDVGLDATGGDDGFGCRNGQYVHYATGAVYTDADDCSFGQGHYVHGQGHGYGHGYGHVGAVAWAEVSSLGAGLLVLLGLGVLGLRWRFV